MFKHWTTVLISHVSKVMFKILQAKLQQSVNWEIPDVQAGFRKGRKTNIPWIIEKAREFQEKKKKSTSALLTVPKPFTVCINTNCGKFWEMGTPDHLTCFLRNLYAGQEATVRTGHETTNWFQIGKEYIKATYYHPAYLT